MHVKIQIFELNLLEHTCKLIHGLQILLVNIGINTHTLELLHGTSTDLVKLKHLTELVFGTFFHIFGTSPYAHHFLYLPLLHGLAAVVLLLLRDQSFSGPCSARTCVGPRFVVL